MLLTLSIVGARRDPIPATEVAVFRALNHGPEWWYPVLWLPMQLGNLVVGTLVGVVICLLAGEPWAALAVVAAMVLKLVTERVIRHEMAGYLRVRRRPGESQPGADPARRRPGGRTQLPVRPRHPRRRLRLRHRHRAAVGAGARRVRCSPASSPSAASTWARTTRST